MKGWLDNFGKADNANDSNVSLPEGFVGLGYNTKGRNYSPAWGGQFKQGGIIPIAQGGVTAYMNKKMQEEKDKGIAAEYNLPEVVVQGFKDASPFDQAARMPEYSPIPTVPYLEKTKDPAEFFKSWITSPEYRQRKIETGYQEFPEYSPVTGDEILDPYSGGLIDREMRSNFLELEKLQRPGAITYDPTKRSEFFEGEGIANINPRDFDGDVNTVKAHEIAHAIDTYESDLSSKEIDLLRSSIDPKWTKKLPKVLTPELWSRVQDAQHLEKPRELRSDLNALRFLMYDKDIYDIRKGKEFTKEDLDKAKKQLKNNKSLDRTLMLTGDENFIKLMNIIAKGDEEVTPIAMGGMSIPGSVGFTYARTAGSAPSEGKYAKKTMASAQNGIMSPLLLGRKILEYIYPSEETANTVEAAPANYKKGLTNELLQRQAYKESTFNPAAVSPAGYKGLTQIGEGVLEDYYNKKGGKKLDPFNPKDAVELQKFAMDDLYNASFINKPEQSDSVRIAKTLAAYNWGRGNLANYLNEQKDKGVDIYGSYDWLNNLPKETSDYVNKILLQEDPSFNKNYKKASTNPKYEEVTSLYDQKKFGGDIPSAQKGKKVSKDATRVDSNASDKFWGIQRELDAQNLSDDSFREKYGMPLHQFKMRDSEYASAFNRQMEQRRMSDPNYAELNLPQTDVRSKIYQGNPNLRFIPGTSDGESRAAMEDLFLATTTATAPLLPVNTAKIAKGAQQFGKYLTDDTFLKNAWRLNPKAYQYNLPENAMWRGIGKEGMEDALSSGVFRAKQNIEPSNYRNSSLNLNKSFGANTYFTPKFKVAGSYGPDYLAEVPRTSANWRNRYAKSDWSQIADRQIPISEGRILQKNWLEGYKEVPQNRVFKSGLPNPIEIVDKIIPRPLAPGSFFGLDDSWNNYSPLNLIPGYGKKLIDNSSTYPNFVGFRKFGNSIDDVIESQSLRPRGSGMGSNQIRSEGNWAESGKVNENYPGVFEATMNPQIPGSNIKLEKISKRNGILGTTNEGDVEIPITDPGLSFNRRLPFSNRYAPIDKEKLINNQFQMSTVAPNLQSLAEKYAIWSGLGLGASSLGYPQLSDANKKYIIDPAVEKYKDLDERLYKLYDQILPSLEIPKKQNGGEMRFYQNGLDWKPKSMQDGGEESFEKKLTNFVSEGISGPVTTVALGLLDMVKPISNSEIYKTIRPVGYPNALKLPVYAYDYLMGNESEPLKTKSGKPHLAEEFWATAMSMPGERQYLKESKYKPSVAKDPDAKYYTIRDIIDQDALIGAAKDLKAGEKMEMNGLLPILDSKWYSENADTDKNVKFGDIDPLQRFTLQKSPDGSYVSIYDKYDFNNPALNKRMNPIEIYDRFYLPKKRKGGVIKDNRGQWAHPGEVTEIDSNYITMEGVPYDVVGVSDAGDTKLMKPGKNYKFKGKKVTEFPVAELGINQLDAQPMKKLNQLLNFTNNPDKDNWLDKYN
jgi:hypothetical protein